MRDYEWRAAGERRSRLSGETLGALLEMRIDLSPPQIDAALLRVSEGLTRYVWLQSRVAEQSGFEQDPEFRRRYNRFYRVRRGPEWQNAFYNLMARAKSDQLDFRAVLVALHGTTNRYEASFASKLVATLDSSKPVIDAFVLRNVGLRLPASAAPDRFERICNVYHELISIFSTFLSSECGHYLITAFRRVHPTATITKVKMLDLVLWQTRPDHSNRTDRRGVVAQRPIRPHWRPSRCPACGASARIAEIQYGLPAFDEELDRNLQVGSIVLGGCCVSDNMPRWRCGTCGHEWGILTLQEPTRRKA